MTSAEMRKRPLGPTGLEVSEVGLGGVFVGEQHATRDEGIRVVHRALELGVNYIDTAPFYGNSQEVLGEALDGRDEEVILGTKCGRWDWRTGPFHELDAFKKQFEQTFRDLRRDRVELLYIHEADWCVWWQDDAAEQGRQFISTDGVYDYANAPVIQFLLWAKEQGLAEHLGISGNNAHLLAKVLKEASFPIDVVLVAFQYSLIWRNAKEHLLPLARDLGVGVVLGSPLQRKLAVPHKEWIEDPPDWMDDDLRDRFIALYEIHHDSGLSLAELGLRFLLADEDITTVIPGAATVVQLEENVASSAADPLSPDVHARLDALGRVVDGLIN